MIYVGSFIIHPHFFGRLFFGGVTAKEKPSTPCVAPATAVPFIRGQSAPPNKLCFRIPTVAVQAGNGFYFNLAARLFLKLQGKENGTLL